MGKPKRVVFTEKDFRVLISGGIVKQNGVEIILQDIGFAKMQEVLNSVIK